MITIPTAGELLPRFRAINCGREAEEHLYPRLVKVLAGKQLYPEMVVNRVRVETVLYTKRTRDVSLEDMGAAASALLAAVIDDKQMLRAAEEFLAQVLGRATADAGA